MKKDICNFVFKKCTDGDLDTILKLQDETFEYLPSADLLRKNTPEMLLECLKEPHFTLGAWCGDELAAFSVLYLPYDESEDLCHCLDGVECAEMRSANYKLCIVKREYRGNSLQYELGVRLTEQAYGMGVDILCCTASPQNTHSINNILRMGYSYNKTLTKYNYQRNLYYKIL